MRCVMRLSVEADYGLRITNYLSELGMDERVRSRRIAEDCCISEKFTLKVLHKLLKGGIVKSYRGVQGGYSIAKEPATITYLDVIELIDGPLYINKCLEDPAHCTANRVPICLVHDRLYNVNKKMEEMLSAYNFGIQNK